ARRQFAHHAGRAVDIFAGALRTAAARLETRAETHERVADQRTDRVLYVARPRGQRNARKWKISGLVRRLVGNKQRCLRICLEYIGRRQRSRQRASGGVSQNCARLVGLFAEINEKLSLLLPGWPHWFRLRPSGLIRISSRALCSFEQGQD